MRREMQHVGLSDEQVAFIEKDIGLRGITSPELCVDLLDHICCLIEDRLDGYRNFDAVYEETILLFGEKGLEEIQLETNRLLTFKNYYIMNSTMKISGYVSSMMILFGAFFKFNHWPGANVLLVVGMFLLTVLFLPLLFILKFKSSAESNRSVVLSIIAFVSALLICVGILFKIMHWPNAQMLTIAGGVLLLFGYLPVYFISIYKNETNKMNATATVVLIIAGVGLAVINSFPGLPRATSDSFWRGVIENDELLQFMNAENAKTYARYAEASNSDSIASIGKLKQLKMKTNELINYMDSLKYNLIAGSESVSDAAARAMHLDMLRNGGAGQTNPSAQMLERGANEKFTASELKRKLEKYKSEMAELGNAVTLQQLSTDSLLVYGERVAWENSNFDKLPLPLIVFNLNRMELAIRSNEAVMIAKILGE